MQAKVAFGRWIRAGLAALGGAVLALNAGKVSAEEVLPPIRVQKVEKAVPAEERENFFRPAPDPAKLRKEYPFRSLKARLEYEQKRRRAGAKPKLSESAEEHLKRLEERAGDSNIRRDSLKLLHSDQVEKFVKAQGFGVGRMAVMEPSPSFLPSAESPQLALTRIPRSDEDAGPTVELPAEEPREERADAWSPSKRDLLWFADQSEELFASPWNLGYVKSVDRVAGFAPHAFIGKPELHHPDPMRDEKMTHRWEIGRLELVSLLKHPEPRVYLSEHLPRMQDLDDKSTRALVKFENEALKQLRAGEDLQTQAETNTIRMVGALRAGKQCIECHQVERGELLGAFTYELKRVPPLPVPKRRAI
ncbi:MAG TPA: hypothetical protein VHB77_20420 [Planctomycetaceae bacterium]|nr:hypothetical protein [Planctomycetaceae bacterium]